MLKSSSCQPKASERAVSDSDTSNERKGGGGGEGGDLAGMKRDAG